MNARPLPDLVYRSPYAALTTSCWAAMPSHPEFGLVVRREFYAHGQTTGEHLHLDFHALYAVRSGRGVHRIGGEPFAITRGDVYLLPVGATHAYQGFHALEIDAFYFPPSLWSDAERLALEEGGLLNEAAPRFRLSPQAWKRAESSIERLRALWRDEARGAAIVLRGAFFAFVWELALRTRVEAPRLPRLDLDGAIGEAIRLCDEEFAHPWTVETLAARVWLSPRHFGELFARRTGQTPALYLRTVRLEHAKTLLRTTALPVGEVALRCGWNDAAHFCRSFQAKFGVSPRALRKTTRG